MNLKAEKKSIIDQVREIEDPELLSAIKLIATYGLKKQAEQDVYNIPDSHKALVRKRIKNTKKEDLMNWNKAVKTLKF
ncbi:MAG: hypothetical protein U0T75_09525 [Chitinophagales bacterium]